MVLIDRDEALRRLRKRREDFASGWRTKEAMPDSARYKYEENLECALIISDQTAVDAVEVVHGHWIEHPKVEFINGKWISNYECSECCCCYRTHENYCGYCGAKMDGDII